MVEEVRRISLTKDEIITAIDAYRRIHNGFLPAGKILHYKITPSGSLNVAVEVAYGATAQTLEFTFKQSDFLDPVIKFCIANNIMLPLDSHKTISFENDKLVLLINMAPVVSEK